MPTVEPAGAKVLVTGANGFLAMWVVQNLLEQGYSVRAVVRSLEKGKHMKEYFKSYSDKLELFVVEDIVKDGAFDEAVKGVDAIEHMASPAILTGIEPEEYNIPAIKGTVGILESALKFGDKVKRIVITSSVVAIYSPGKEPTFVFDESHWAGAIVDLVKEKGKDAPPLVKYSASKTLAEKAAWEFYNAHKAQAKWDLVVLNPPFVLGPPLYEVKRPEDLNVSLLIFWKMITEDVPEENLKGTYSFVDVRDISAAHVAVLRNTKAADERIIISKGSATWQETRNFIHSLHPELYTSGILPRGNPNLDAPLSFDYNNEKAKKILGNEYTAREKTVNDLLADFKARGWLNKPVSA